MRQGLLEIALPPAFQRRTVLTQDRIQFGRSADSLHHVFDLHLVELIVDPRLNVFQRSFRDRLRRFDEKQLGVGEIFQLRDQFLTLGSKLFRRGSRGLVGQISAITATQFRGQSDFRTNPQYTPTRHIERFASSPRAGRALVERFDPWVQIRGVRSSPILRFG